MIRKSLNRIGLLEWFVTRFDCRKYSDLRSTHFTYTGEILYSSVLQWPIVLWGVGLYRIFPTTTWSPVNLTPWDTAWKIKFPIALIVFWGLDKAHCNCLLHLDREYAFKTLLILYYTNTIGTFNFWKWPGSIVNRLLLLFCWHELSIPIRICSEPSKCCNLWSSTRNSCQSVRTEGEMYIMRKLSIVSHTHEL